MRGQRWLRAVAAVLALLAGALAASLAGSWGAPAALAVAPTVLAAASAAYVTGLVWWRGQPARWLRGAGWLCMAAAAAIPSQLTLVLPLVAPLVVTVHRVPDDLGGRPASRRGRHEVS